jgi:Abortive infection alpha
MPEPVTTAAAAAAKAVSKAHQSDAELPPEAGEFLARVSGGPLHEIGAWLGDHVRVWRVQRQIGILERAQRDLLDTGRNPRQVKWNVLFPLLEAGSLEDDPEMAERWAALLANAADPEATEVPPSFPDILKQLSPAEARILDAVFGALVEGGEDAILHGARVRLALGVDEETYTVAVENLYRERLLKPVSVKLDFIEPADTRYATDTLETVMLTALGEAFVRACRRDGTSRSDRDARSEQSEHAAE